MKLRDFKAMLGGIPDSALDYEIEFESVDHLKNPLGAQVEVDNGDAVLDAQGGVISSRAAKVIFKQV